MLRWTPKPKEESISVEDRIEMGNALLNERRLLDALAEFELVLQKAPEFNVIHMKVGYIHLQRRNYRLALDAFHQAMALDTLSPGAPEAAGWAYLKLGELDQAEKYFRVSLAIDPKLDSALSGLGQVAMQRQQYPEAAQYFQQALAINPGLLNGQIGLAEAYRCQGQLDRAISVLEALPQTGPSSAFARIQLGRLYREKRQYPTARASFQKAWDTNPVAVTLNSEAQLDFVESLLIEQDLVATADTLQSTPDFLRLACRKSLLQGNLYLRQGEEKLALEQYLLAGQLKMLVANRITSTLDLSALQTELQLHRALQNQELQIHYQPIVSLADPQILLGMSSLLSWNHPQQGVLVRDQLWPDIEALNLLLPLGWWQLYQACQNLAQLQPQFPQLQWIGVNLNPIQLQDPDLETQLLFALNAAQLVETKALFLEVNSYWLAERQAAASPELNQLQQLPVQLVAGIDTPDLSLLELLRHSPISALKIQPSITQNLSLHQNCNTVAMATALAQELGILTIGAGVETVEQAKQLQSLGCQYAQGSLFGLSSGQGNIDASRL